MILTYQSKVYDFLYALSLKVNVYKCKCIYEYVYIPMDDMED